MQLVQVKFGVDKRGSGSYSALYNGRAPNRSKFYNYLWDGTILQKGDYVVVNTPSHGLTVVEVTDVEFGRYDTDAWKWIVDKVQWGQFQAEQSARLGRRRAEAERRLEERAVAQRRADQLATLEAALQRKMAEAKEKLFQQYAFSMDPSLKELQDQINALRG